MTYEERINALVSEAAHKRCESSEDLIEIFRLRNEFYQREAGVASNITGDDHDSVPNCTNIGLYLDGSLVAAARYHLILTEDDSSICSSLFPRKVSSFLGSGTGVVEMSHFIASLDAARKTKLLPYLSLRLAILACKHHSCELLMFAIKPEHGAFYRKVLMAEGTGETGFLAGHQAPLELYTVNMRKNHKVLSKKYSWLKPLDESECYRLFGPSRTLKA